jgi:O-antigen chain-terminating methyltransferase
VPEAKDHPALERLRRRLQEEEAAYVAALAALDRAAAAAAPDPGTREARAAREELNASWSTPAPPAGEGLGGVMARRAYTAVAPALAHQERFNAALVRLLNAQQARQAEQEERLARLLAALVEYAQRVEPMMDVRDEARVAEAPTDAQLLLAEFERRIEALRQRVDGLLTLRERLELVSEELRALRGTLAAAAPPAAVAARAERSADDAGYTAFENCFRGSREAIRAQQADYVDLFRGLEPVVDLGCGRGEFLQSLREAGLAARGVEGNANVVRECREKGLDVVEGDLVAFLREQEAGSLGGVFAAQVVEHLPPAVLQGLLAAAHSALRPGGLLVLETVNAASALAFLDVFIRDLTHQRPLHPDTLRFLAAAAGFVEARIEWRSPVPEDVRLHTAPSGTLAPPLAQVFNENVARLNALLFAPLDYALVARR